MNELPYASRYSSLANTPPPVLALICQHLQVPDLLRLLRCCSTLHRLIATDASFSSAAWSAARLRLRLHQRLHEWTLPYRGCVCNEWLSPLALLQQAVPVIQYTLEQRERDRGRAEHVQHGTSAKRALVTVWTKRRRHWQPSSPP